jgi:hypothetical protein
MGEWKYSSTHFNPAARWQRVVSFTHRPLCPLVKSLWYPLGRMLGGPQCGYRRGSEDRWSFLYPCRVSNPGRPARRLVALLTEVLRLTPWCSMCILDTVKFQRSGLWIYQTTWTFQEWYWILEHKLQRGNHAPSSSVTETKGSLSLPLITSPSSFASLRPQAAVLLLSFKYIWVWNLTESTKISLRIEEQRSVPVCCSHSVRNVTCSLLYADRVYCEVRRGERESVLNNCRSVTSNRVCIGQLQERHF